MTNFTDVLHHKHDTDQDGSQQDPGHSKKHSFRLSSHLHHKSKHEKHDDKTKMAPLTLQTSVAVAGITGKLGRLITKHLLSHENVTVHGIARNPDKLPDDLKTNPRLKLFKCDLSNRASLREAVRGCSILISTVLVYSDPFLEVAIQKAMIDACVSEGVPRFMPNEFTVDWRCAELDLIPTKKANQVVYEHIAKQDGKVKGVHMLVGGFMESLFSLGFWYPPDRSPAEGLSAYGTGDEIWEMTSYDNAAQFATAVALDANATGFLRFLGDRLTVKEIAKTLEEVYNLPPIPFTSKGSMEDLDKKVRETLDHGSDTWTSVIMGATLAMSNGKAYLETPLNNPDYGNMVMQQTLEDWLADRKVEELSKSVQF